MATYPSTYPLSQREKYYPNENVDFVLNFTNKTIQPNSVGITGRVVVYTGDAGNPQPIAADDAVYYDGQVGAHGLFQTYTTSFSDRVFETFNHYPRFIKMDRTARMTSEDSSAMASQAVQLVVFDQQQPETAGEPTTCETSTAVMHLEDVADGGRAFYIKPEICLNNTAGGISWGSSGEIKLSVMISSVNQFLYGDDVPTDANNVQFYLTDLELCYKVVPQVKVEPITMIYRQAIKHIISSNNQTLNFKTPIPTTSMACSFILVNSENDTSMNYLTMDPLEGISRVDWSIDDLNQGVLEYPLENYEEIKLNYLMAVLEGAFDYKQSIEPRALEAPNKIRGVGLSYLRTLQNDKVAINILSDASNQNQYAVYIYFKGQITV